MDGGVRGGMEVCVGGGGGVCGWDGGVCVWMEVCVCGGRCAWMQGGVCVM